MAESRSAATPSTPRRKVTIDPSEATTLSRTALHLAASPHYQTSRRHSLYGTEDRVVIDPGSRIWKIGYSGEGKPRDFFLTGFKEGGTLWSLHRATNTEAREEEVRLLIARLQDCLRNVFLSSLLTDPKSRKLIILEHPLLPLYIKEMMTRLLFNNLQVPSITWISSPVLAIFAAGRSTGLILDCGHLTSTVLPVFAARPMYHQLQTTPLAGARFSSHLRALVLMFGTYVPPPPSLNAAPNIPIASRSTRVPDEILTEAVIEEIKTRVCFVGDTLNMADSHAQSIPDESMEIDAPPSDAGMSESDFSYVSADQQSNISSQQAGMSEFSVVSHSQATSSLDRPQPGETHIQALAKLYMRHSTATDLRMPVTPPVSQQAGTGKGTLVVPGWVRERAAEVLFEGGDIDELSVAEVILETILKVPVDLRRTFASSVLVTGGTAMTPGFIPRLQTELIRAVMPSQNATSSVPPGRLRRPPRPSSAGRYHCLQTLVPYFAILNHPSPPTPTTSKAAANAGKAPTFTPATFAWMGGSIVGVLKTGSVEITREKWDEAEVNESTEDLTDPNAETVYDILPDWTRVPLSDTTSPQAARPQQGASPIVITPTTAVPATTTARAPVAELPKPTAPSATSQLAQGAS